MIKSFKQGSYRRQVAVLLSGTVAAQAIPIAASPILTRVYAPEDFGLLALYGSIASILTGICTAQYELAITLPAKVEDAASVVSLCIRVCGAFSLFLLILVSLFDQQVAHWLGHPEIAVWLYLLPLTVFAAGLFKTYTFWSNRQSDYGLIAKQTFQLSAVTVASSIALGFASLGGGQIIGILIGRVTSAISMFFAVYRVDKPVLSQAFNRPVRPMAVRYKSHPVYFMPSRLILEFAMQIPVFMVSNLFLISTVGFFSLANKLVAMPTALIANAIGNVYRQRISDSYNKHGHYRHIYKRTLQVTIIVSIVPFGLLYLAAPMMFSVAFGETWRVAGSYAQILMVSTFFSFITTPLNKGAIVVGAKRYDLMWNITRFGSYSMLWLAAQKMQLSVEVVLWSYVLINIVLYVTDAFYQYHLSGGTGKARKLRDTR